MEKKMHMKHKIGIKQGILFATILTVILGIGMNVSGETYEVFVVDMETKDITKQTMDPQTGEIIEIPYDKEELKKEIKSSSKVDPYRDQLLELGLPVAFYAEIVDLWTNEYGTVFHVDGLDINDINHRYEFTLDIDERTVLSWCGTTLEVDDFSIGDLVSVMYDGTVVETYPAQIECVCSITLLEDEKRDS